MAAFRSKFARDVLIYTVANFLVAGVPFLLMPILTRTLSPDAYGIVAMFSAILPFFIILVGFNLHGAVMVRYFNSENFDISRYVTNCFVIMLVTAGLLAIGVFFFSEPLQNLTTLPRNWLMIAVMTAVCLFPIQILLTLWQSSKQPLKYGGLRLSQATLDALLSFTLVVLIPLSWQGRISGIALAALLIAVVSTCLLIRNGWLVSNISRPYIADALRFGVPLLPHAIGGLLLAMMDRFMVTHYLDVSSTGIYFVGIQIGMVLGIAADAFNRAFAPWLMESLHRTDPQRDVRIVKFTYSYFFVILTTAIIGGLVAPDFLSILVGEKYQYAAEIAQYTLLGNAFGGMYLMVTNYIFFARRTELLSILTMVCGIISIMLAWHLIQEKGVVGAAQAYMAGQAIMFFGTWVLAQQCHKMPWFKFSNLLNTLK